MTKFVLDCSVTMAWLFRDEATDYTESALNALEKGAGALVPALWPLEVSNVLLVGERRGRISAAQTTGFIQVLEGFDIRIDSETAERAPGSTVHLARQHGLSAYDAAYLELSLRSGRRLVALDKKLRSAAKASGAQIW